MPMHRPRALLAAAVLAIATLGATACGQEEAPAGATEQQAGARGPQAERAFLRAMVPHHESAIAMARVAQERAETPKMRKFARDIVRTQGRELGELRRLHERLFGQPLRPDPGAHTRLGLSAEQAGMTHGAADTAALERATPFDRAFVDMMAPHHAGAVRMARAVLPGARDPELPRLATALVRDQSRELAAMDAFRRARYGEGLPGAHGAGAGHGA